MNEIDRMFHEWLQQHNPNVNEQRKSDMHVAWLAGRSSIQPAMNSGKHFYEIRTADIGKMILNTSIGQIYVSDLMGKIMACDIGKRIFRRGGIYQVENDIQRNKRIS